jgi:hypothetical protein
VGHGKGTNGATSARVDPLAFAFFSGKFSINKKGRSSMFETDERVQRMIDEVYNLTLDLQRGDLLTHDAIRNVLGIEPHQGSWDHVVGRARRRLERERGIATWYDLTLGYRLLTKNEQIMVGQKRTAKAQRQLLRGARSVEALPEGECSDNQRRARFLALASIQAARKAIRKERRNQEKLFRPFEFMPRRTP